MCEAIRAIFLLSADEAVVLTRDVVFPGAVCVFKEVIEQNYDPTALCLILNTLDLQLDFHIIKPTSQILEQSSFVLSYYTVADLKDKFIFYFCLHPNSLAEPDFCLHKIRFTFLTFTHADTT